MQDQQGHVQFQDKQERSVSCQQFQPRADLLSTACVNAIFRDAFSTTNELIVQVTSIMMIVPFNTSSLNNRIGSPVAVSPKITLYPTSTTASVAPYPCIA